MEKVRKTTKEISDAIRKGSKFMYYEGISFKASSTESKIKRESLEYNIVTGVITKGDFYLLEAVHKLGFATAQTLLHLFRNGMRHGDEASICLVKEGKVVNHRTIRGRLEYLARQGLLHCHEYVDMHENINYIYMCSSEGFRAFCNALDRMVPYNKDMVYKPSHEVFRYLAVNTVEYVFALHGDCKKTFPYGKFVYNSNGKVLNEFVYGRMEFERLPGRNMVYFLEPVFFSVDIKITSWDENVQRIKKRIENLRSIAKAMMEDGTEAKIVFIVENGDGMKHLKELLMEYELDFFLGHCLFTSENVVSATYAERGDDASDSLLCMYVSGGQLKFKQRDLEVE